MVVILKNYTEISDAEKRLIVSAITYGFTEALEDARKKLGMPLENSQHYIKWDSMINSISKQIAASKLSSLKSIKFKAGSFVPPMMFCSETKTLFCVQREDKENTYCKKLKSKSRKVALYKQALFSLNNALECDIKGQISMFQQPGVKVSLTPEVENDISRIKNLVGEVVCAVAIVFCCSNNKIKSVRATVINSNLDTLYADSWDLDISFDRDYVNRQIDEVDQERPYASILLKDISGLGSEKKSKQKTKDSKSEIDTSEERAK